MADEIKPVIPPAVQPASPSIFAPAPRPVTPAVDAPRPSFFAPKPADPVSTEPKIDHLAEIAELAKSLHNVSPSGAQTVSGQILEHISALQVEADKAKKP